MTNKYKILLYEVFVFLKQQDKLPITLDLVGRMEKVLAEDDEVDTWVRYDADDLNTMPPANVPLFVAYRSNNAKFIKLGMLVMQEDDSYVWMVDGRYNLIDPYEPLSFTHRINDKDVVAWVAMPTKFPEEVD